MLPLLLLCSQFLLVAARSVEYNSHQVYWNSSNPMFETFETAIDSPGYYEMSARPGDIVKFHCPKKRSREFSIIYKVSKECFTHCVLYEGQFEPVGSCDTPSHSLVHRHTLKRTTNDGTNYYITTSTGTMAGLKERRLGLCLERNMRLAINLGPPDLQPYNEGMYGIPMDAERLSNEKMYLAEENGEVSWKKNVHPQIEEEMERDIKETRLKFDKSKQIEPIPINEEFFINRLEEHRRKHPTDVIYPDFNTEKDAVDSSRGNHFTISTVFFIVIFTYFLL